MDSLIETFHINISLLIAQVINFAIVFAVIYYFAFKPLLKIMNERTRVVEESLKNAEEIKKNLANTEIDYDKKLGEAKKEAKAIMEKSSEQSEKKKQETIKKAKEEIGLVINQEKAKMQSEKASTLLEIKSEIADLVSLTVEKVLEEKMDGKKDQEIIKKMIN